MCFVIYCLCFYLKNSSSVPHASHLRPEVMVIFQVVITEGVNQSGKKLGIENQPWMIGCVFGARYFFSVAGSIGIILSIHKYIRQHYTHTIIEGKLANNVT
jgi:hypothetical protein